LLPDDVKVRSGSVGFDEALKANQIHIRNRCARDIVRRSARREFERVCEGHIERRRSVRCLLDSIKNELPIDGIIWSSNLIVRR